MADNDVQFHNIGMRGMPPEVKQVIVMRTDLGMRKGKMIAQGAHACMAAVFKNSFIAPSDNGPLDHKVIPYTQDLETWFNDCFTKVCLKATSEEMLLDIEKQANELGIVNFLITDAGKTEFNGVPTRTCIALGPAPAALIDQVTGDLKLL